MYLFKVENEKVLIIAQNKISILFFINKKSIRNIMVM